MEKEELYQIAKDAVNEAELKSDEIPAIDLYVDQIINLVAEKLKQSSERFHERHLTKTMINNYSKDGLITPVKGKKYTKEQVIQMLTVYTLKSSLSIGEIKRLLNGAYSAENFSGEDLTRLYDRDLDIKQENRAYAEEILFSLIEGHGLDLSDMDDYITAVGAVISLSAHLKNIAQAMIDAQFPEPEEPEEDEKSEKKRAKEAREKEKSREKKKKHEDSAENGEPEEPEITEYVETKE